MNGWVNGIGLMECDGDRIGLRLMEWHGIFLMELDKMVLTEWDVVGFY
jgi:hypothetical protein